MQNENYLTMVECIRKFLEDLGLVQYFDMFLIKGFDSEDDIRHIDEHDLDSMLISDTDHRRQIIYAASEYVPSDEFKMFEWLRHQGLDHYFINFIQSEITDIEQISRLNLPDEEIYDELEITLPGHKRRLERAVRQLQKKRRVASPTTHDSIEEPLAFGRWSKPECLRDAKFDFLVVDAKILSTRDPTKSSTLEFMVDSGSDVVTIRQSILDTLDLEILGKIHSKGVHGSKTTNLYKATLQIGTQQMEIEVMGETYDSLGSRVVRHFRHIVDGHQHIWLKGNYTDSQTISHIPPALRLPEPSQQGPEPSTQRAVSMESSSSAEPASSSSLLSTSESLTSSSQGTLSSRPSLPSSQSLPTEDQITHHQDTQMLSQEQSMSREHSQNLTTEDQNLHQQDTQILSQEPSIPHGATQSLSQEGQFAQTSSSHTDIESSPSHKDHHSDSDTDDEDL